jgi:YHS domain-containing protein
LTSSTTLHPDAQTQLCAGCGCSLVRLGIDRDRAPKLVHNEEELRFCCEGCLGVFKEEPDRLLAQIRDIVVCPGCLGEKHVSQTVAVEHDGRLVRFRQCPHCAEAFRKDPDHLLQRLAF